MAVERTAQAVWEGELAKGSGRFTSGSGALGENEVTWASRTERSEGKTSPEELIAAAHATCFSMALSHTLKESGAEPERLDVKATVTLDTDGGPKIASSRLDVTGRVGGVDEAGFEKAASEAAEGCPVSQALDLEISVDARLEH